MPRHDGVAGGEQHHTVEHVGFHGQFDFVRDVVAAGQFDVTRILEDHSVADSGCHHFKRKSARVPDALFDAFGKSAQMDVSGVVLVPGVHDRDDRAFELLFRVAHAADESAAAFAGDAVFTAASFVGPVHECTSEPDN